MNTAAELSNIDVKVGRDVLHLPGTNGDRDFEGSTPGFLVTGYTGYGVTEISMPYYRNDDQIQYALNATWIKGAHSIRFGGDFGFQGDQPHPGVDWRLARPRRARRLRVRSRPDADPGRPGGQQLQLLGDVPARPADPDGPRPAVGSALHHAQRRSTASSSATSGRSGRS